MRIFSASLLNFNSNKSYIRGMNPYFARSLLQMYADLERLGSIPGRMAVTGGGFTPRMAAAADNSGYGPQTRAMMIHDLTKTNQGTPDSLDLSHPSGFRIEAHPEEAGYEPEAEGQQEEEGHQHLLFQTHEGTPPACARCVALDGAYADGMEDAAQLSHPNCKCSLVYAEDWKPLSERTPADSANDAYPGENAAGSVPDKGTPPESPSDEQLDAFREILF